MKFFVILEILFLAARISVLFVSEKLPPAVIKALTWGCVVFGVIASVFIVVRIYKELRR